MPASVSAGFADSAGDESGEEPAAGAVPGAIAGADSGPVPGSCAPTPWRPPAGGAAARPGTAPWGDAGELPGELAAETPGVAREPPAATRSNPGADAAKVLPAPRVPGVPFEGTSFEGAPHPATPAVRARVSPGAAATLAAVPDDGDVPSPVPGRAPRSTVASTEPAAPWQSAAVEPSGAPDGHPEPLNVVAGASSSGRSRSGRAAPSGAVPRAAPDSFPEAPSAAAAASFASPRPRAVASRNAWSNEVVRSRPPSAAAAPPPSASPDGVPSADETVRRAAWPGRAQGAPGADGPALIPAERGTGNGLKGCMAAGWKATGVPHPPKTELIAAPMVDRASVCGRQAGRWHLLPHPADSAAQPGAPSADKCSGEAPHLERTLRRESSAWEAM
jgi:hypothetical protein